MELIEILIIALAVSMDAFAVSVCKGLSVRNIRPYHVLLTSVWFGGFQALMPLIGYFLGSSFTDFVSDVDHWIVFILLGIIGLNMIRESFSDDVDEIGPDFSFKVMSAMAVATSIDALTVGVSMAFLKVDIWLAVAVIGVVTALFSAIGVILGNVFGSRHKSKAEFAGGLMLVMIGSKILFEHIGLF